MARSWWFKFLFLVVSIIVSGMYVYPTLSQMNVEKSKFPFKQKVNLGLDLQGGLYMVLGIDFNKVFKDVIERQVSVLSEQMKEKNISFKNVQVVESAAKDDPRLMVTLEPTQQTALKELIKKTFVNLRLTDDRQTEHKDGIIELGLTTEFKTDVREKTLNQSIEVIRNRIDEFGVSEPAITSQGTDRVVVELPGVKDVDRAKELIGRTAKLEFKMVNDKAMSSAQLFELIETIQKDHQISFKEGEKFSQYVTAINEKAKSKIPAGTEIAFERTPGRDIPYLLFSKAEVTGTELSDASIGIDQENQRPYVSFSLNPRGTVIFDKLSGEHIGERLAIVLDNIVHSAPVFQSRIPNGHGQITLGRGAGDEVMKEAKDLAIVLRAGALPAQLDFLEQRAVGPSLGQDSIKKGAWASVIGSILVFLFVMFYYRVSGVIAVISLLLNVLFVIAALVGIDATLTLPGIAGIALTVGIAVDSNVVIYERIREELRAGKNIHGAVESGFQKAFRTILDANITNAAAAIVLLIYGTGPIKGFAVTMLIGIITTLFTAIFACKVIFDAYLKKLEDRNAKTISI